MKMSVLNYNNRVIPDVIDIRQAKNEDYFENEDNLDS